MKNLFTFLCFLPLAVLGCSKPHTHFIEKITFSTGGGMSRARSDMTIDSNRKAVRTYTDYNGTTNGPLKCIIDTASFNKIIAELNELDFPALKNSYTENATDCATYILTITYDNGKVKTINDYCRQGPKGLLAVYEDLFILESSQKWANANK
jgi:hypothetical protein